jgi:hypothetical protein
MSDSLPPDGGPDPYDGWDLEGVLSGENVWVPERMRPVVGALAALRAAPVRAEMAGEAAARAAFREIMLAGGIGPAAPGASARERAGDARTLIRPARAADGGPHGVTRPRHSHRRPPRRGRWQSRALAGAAAAVVIAGGIALAGAFSRAGGHPGQPGDSSGTTTAVTQSGSGGPGSNGLEGSATKEATRSPAPGASGGQQSPAGPGTGPAALCRQYWAFLASPGSSASWKAESENLQQLSELAGGLWNINRYCTVYDPGSAEPSAPASNPGNYPGGPDFQVPSDSPGNGQANPPAGNGKAGNGNPSNGNGGSGNGGKGNGGKGNGGKGGNSSGGGGQQQH